ncbi:hypothetical protein OH764_33035 (plasmid) [Burkholderia sp. M6-3]
MYLNFNKPLIGFWLLSYPWVKPNETFPTEAVSALGACALTSAACLIIAFEADSIAWAPECPHLGWLEMLNSFLLVAFAEQAFLRGYNQAGLACLIKSRPQAWWLGFIVAAVLSSVSRTIRVTRLWVCWPDYRGSTTALRTVPVDCMTRCLRASDPIWCNSAWLPIHSSPCCKKPECVGRVRYGSLRCVSALME